MNEYQSKYARTTRGQFTELKSRAKKGTKEMTITYEEYATIRTLPCEYCGGKLPKVGHGLDRINSNKGYTLKNSVPCCYRCNMAKSSMTLKQFKSHIKTIYKHFIKK